jgi:hypothetical protein
MQKKSIFLVIICLFLGAGLSQISAQSETGWFSGDFFTEVNCDGNMLGHVYGTLNVHFVDHYQDGEWIFWNYMAKGEAVCTFSDEKFTYKEKGKEWNKTYPIGSYVVHLKGDQGSKYMAHLTIDYSYPYPWKWTFQITNCH